MPWSLPVAVRLLYPARQLCEDHEISSGSARFSRPETAGKGIGDETPAHRQPGLVDAVTKPCRDVPLHRQAGLAQRLHGLVHPGDWQAIARVDLLVRYPDVKPAVE